jgi:hypothetical protein
LSGSKIGDSSQRPKEDCYFLMLKVTPEKEVVPVKWLLSNLDESSASLVIDESSERLYLWIGESVDGITKAVARRRAADISSQGFRLENISHPIGKVAAKKLEIVELAQGDVNKDFKVKEIFNDLKNLFRKKTELLEDGMLARSSVKIPEAKRDLREGFTRSPPKFEEVSKALEEKFGKAPEILAERETMLERYKEREYDKVAAIYTIAFVDILGGKANVEISRQGRSKVYNVSKPAVIETQPAPEMPKATEETVTGEAQVTVEATKTIVKEKEKKCSYVIEDKKLRVIESNLTQEELNRVMKRVEELTL